MPEILASEVIKGTHNAIRNSRTRVDRQMSNEPWEPEEQKSTPVTYEQAIHSPQGKQWQTAVEKELSQMAKLWVWEPADLPSDREQVSTKWVFKVKTVPGSQRKIYKARLFCRGFSQQTPGEFDPDATYGQVSRSESLETVLSVAASGRLKCFQADMSSAHFNAPLKEDIFITTPKGFKEDGVSHLKLRKSIYGLRQSAANWAQTLRETMEKLDLKPTVSEPCLFTGTSTERFLGLACVDDLVIVSKTNRQIQFFLSALLRHFEITSKPLSFFLGIETNIPSTSIKRLTPVRFWNDSV